MSETPERPREIRFTPDPDNLAMFGAVCQPTESHFCETCGEMTTHVIGSHSFLDGRGDLWPYHVCQFCGSQVPRNHVFFCCRACNPDMFVYLDQDMTPQDAATALRNARRELQSQESPQAPD